MKSLRDKRQSALKPLFYAALIAIAVSEFVVVRVLHWGHGYFWFEEIPAFSAVYGFLSCLLIIIAAKFVLANLIGRREDYYD